MERTYPAGSKISTSKETKPFRAARQDGRDIFDCRTLSFISRVPDDPIDFRCRPQTILLSSIMRSDGLKPVDLSAAPVSIFERRYFWTLTPKLSCGCCRTQSTLSRERFSPLAHRDGWGM